MLAVVFLGGMAIEIAAPPLAIIIFGVVSMMLWDFVDTMRASLRNGNGNGNGDGSETTET